MLKKIVTFAALLHISLIQSICYSEDAFLAQHREAIAGNPEDVSFAIAIDKTNFYMGEEIPITLSYSTSVENRYWMTDKQAHDRMRSMMGESFFIDPREGTTDPLHWKINGYPGFIGYSVSFMSIGPFDLGVETVSVTISLNEFFRFDRPGTYRLYLTSSRVYRPRDVPDQNGNPKEYLRIASNIVEFEITPLDNRKKQEIIQAEIKTIRGYSNIERKIKAYRALRFFGEKECIEPLLDGLLREQQIYDIRWECKAGLYGSRYPQFVIEKMGEKLDDADAAIGSEYVKMMAQIEYGMMYPDLLPRYPAGDEEAIKRYNKIRNEAIAKYDEILAGFNRRLSNANHSKNPKARVESLLTEIKFFRKDNEKDTDEKIKSLQEQFSQAFLESYSSFEPERLQRIIESNGDSLSTQKMLPMYRDVFARPPYVKNGSTKDIADFALLRIYQIAPDEGRRLILDEVQSPNPKTGIQILGRLPEERLPDLQNVVVDNLANWQDPNQGRLWFENKKQILTLTRLIERYADAAVLQKVKELYRNPTAAMKNHWSDIRKPLIAYFLQTDESFARKCIEEWRKESRASNFLLTDMLYDIAKIHPSPILEEYVIPNLKDENPQKVQRAIYFIQSFGSKSSIQPLWDCFERWYETWKDKAPALESRRGIMQLHPHSAEVGGHLVDALASHPAFVANADDLKRIESMCLTNYMKNRIKTLIKRRSQ